MKSLALILLVVAAAAAAPDGNWPGFPRRSVQKRDSSAVIDDYMDRVLNQTKEFMLANNLDPYALTDQYLVNFTFKDLLGIKWKTRLGLFSGEARDLTTISRDGHATLTYTSDARNLDLQAGVVFDDIQISYTYAAQLLNIGPAGVFTATVKGLKADVDIALNIRSFNATLKDFNISSAKSIKVDVKGLTFLGNLAVEAFINTFLLILKGPILKVVEKQVLSALTAGVSGTEPGALADIISEAASN